jgi:nucleotide-binding universal stress UspA family protein
MRVIVAIDGSEKSSDLIEKVARRPWPIDTEIKILTVVQPLVRGELQSPGWAEVAAGALRKRSSMASAECAKQWHYLQQCLPQAITHFEVREGEPREEIVKAASEWNANLIILAAPGRASKGGPLIGSVSSGVMRYAGCSVELIRTPARVARTETSAGVRTA